MWKKDTQLEKIIENDLSNSDGILRHAIAE
jgi:hypothetical protein